MRRLFGLIDWMMRLPQELEEAFESELLAHEQEKRMPYISSVERNTLERGREEGRGEGLLEGVASWRVSAQVRACGTQAHGTGSRPS